MDSLAIIALLLFVCAVSCGGWAIWAYLHREPEPRSYGDEGGHPSIERLDIYATPDAERVMRRFGMSPPSAWRGTSGRR